MAETFSSLADFCISLFGQYVPITYLDPSGNTVIPAGLAGVNMQYVSEVLLFSLVVYSLFRIVGVFMQSR